MRTCIITRASVPGLPVRCWLCAYQKITCSHAMVAWRRLQVSTDKAAPKEYLRLVINALKLAQEGDAEAIAQLKPHAVAAVAGELRLGDRCCHVPVIFL